MSISEEGLKLWKEHFAKKPNDDNSIFSVSIHVSQFNFIVHLLMTPDRFGWTIHMLKSPLQELLSENSKNEESILFHIPNKCSTTQAPVCQMVVAAEATEKSKEIAGDSPNQQDAASMALLQPFGTDNIKKRREGKTPLVESEVRRSDRIKKDNDGFRRCSSS